MLLSGSPRLKISKSADKTDKSGKMLSWSMSGSVGQELDQLAKERTIQTDPGETRRRRTIRLVRQAGHHCRWGFTLQTYGIRHKATGEVEVMTYVDYVEVSSAAWIAGMRKGDVLLSVNGESVEGLNHDMLVSRIQHSPEVLRLVVLFEDCCRKVDLYERFIKLKRVLAKKKRELSQIEHREKVLRSRGLLSPESFSRDSVRSSSSSTCSDWDRFSELGCAGSLDSPLLLHRPDWHPHPPDHNHPPSPLTSPAAPSPRVDVSDNAPANNGPALPPSGPSREDSSSDSSGVNLRVTNHQAADNLNDVPQEEEPQHSDTGRRRRSGQEEAKKEEEEEEEEEKEEFSESSSSRGSQHDEDSSSESDAVPPPVCRMRSNSTILNDMRMKLLASAAARLLEGSQGVEEEEEEDHTESDSQPEEISDSEVIVEIKEGGKRAWEDREEEREGRGKEEDVEGKKEGKGIEKEEEEEEERGPGVEDDRGELEEAEVSFRLCEGVRVNDNDIVTKM